MKKRSKILASLAMFVLCVGTLVYGVWSASTATFNVTSNLSFNPIGVYVGVDGQVKRGASVNALNNLAEPTGKTVDYTYSDKNFTANVKIKFVYLFLKMILDLQNSEFISSYLSSGYIVQIALQLPRN